MDIKLRLEEGLEKHTVKEGVITNIISKTKDKWDSLKDNAKREGAETKAMAVLIGQALRGQKLSSEEKQFIKSQSLDIAKITTLIGLSAVPIPGITPALMLLNKKFPKTFNIYPKKHDIPKE